MFGQVPHDMRVDVAASSAWKLYETLQLAKIVQEGLPHMLEKIEIIEGDVGVGTVLQLIFLGGEGMPEHKVAKEKFTTIDNVKYIKEVEAIEGGFLDLGFTQFRVCFITEKGKESCIINSRIEYDANEEAISIASTLPSLQLEAIAGEAKVHLLKMKNEAANSPVLNLVMIY